MILFWCPFWCGLLLLNCEIFFDMINFESIYKNLVNFNFEKLIIKIKCNLFTFVERKKTRKVKRKILKFLPVTSKLSQRTKTKKKISLISEVFLFFLQTILYLSLKIYNMHEKKKNLQIFSCVCVLHIVHFIMLCLAILDREKNMPRK